ncbi:MAG: hypothetical protein K9M99_02000 [Candidatus Cloacimonetes bacterium]|nr:hypothetical protein [Candidatus Cloacimonadota bacterium]
MINKRFKILLIIAICLVIVHLTITITGSLKSIKIPPSIKHYKPAVAKQAVPAISRIRGGNDSNIDSRFIDPDNKRVFINLYDIACKYCKPEEVDFSQEVILDSVIGSGELMKGLVSARLSWGSPPKQYYFVEKKSDGRIALINGSYCQGYYPLQIWMYEGLNRLFDQLDHDEIMLSMFYNKCSNRPSDQLADSFSDRINKLINTLNDQYVYRIYVNPASCEVDSLIEIKGIQLKYLLECNFQEITPEITESIVWNDEIPYKLKQSFSERYISAFFFKGKTVNPTKDKYFKYLLKIVTEGSLNSAWTAEKSAFQEYYYYDHIDAADLIDFSNKVITLNINPQTVLFAYSIKTFCYLGMKKTEQATQLAVEAMNMYDELYQEGFKGILNFQAAASCLTYVLKTENNPQKIREYIESFESPANKPEFSNYLLFLKAVLTELTASTIEETITAFEKIQLDKEKQVYITGLENYIKGYGRSNDVDYYHLKSLKEAAPEIVTMNEPFIAKKFLLSNESQTLNLSGKMDIIIIQKQLSSLANRLKKDKKYIWHKAKIGNEIYWIQTHEEIFYGF